MSAMTSCRPSSRTLMRCGKFAFAAADAAAGDIGELLAGLVDDAEAGDAQSGVDAENAQRGNRAQAGSSMTAVV